MIIYGCTFDACESECLNNVVFMFSCMFLREMYEMKNWFLSSSLVYSVEDS